MWCQTRVHSLSHSSGRLSAPSLVPLLASPLNTMHNPMVILNGSTRNWRPPCAVLSPRTRPHGVIWSRACQVLLRLSAHYKKVADRQRTSAPLYPPSHPSIHPLRVESRKLAPRFLGAFPISKVINTLAVRLRLPKSLRVHLTHSLISAQVKLTKESF